MKPLSMLGIVLMVAGAVIFALKGISFTTDKETVGVGPVEVTAEKKETIPPVYGLVALAAGAVLFVVGRKK
ncbi:MAG: DUF3185 domain-containing protein [Gemmatimonadaceae bacterium]